MCKLVSLWILFLLTLYEQGVFGRRSRDNRDQRYRPLFKDTETNITVGPGERAVLKCIVENLGTKTVTWRRDKEVHPLTIGLFTFVSDTRITVDYNQRSNEWSLMIQDITPEDEGTYHCVISSKHDGNKSYEIKLNVKNLEDDSTPAVQVSGKEYVEMGSTIHLVCNATGKPHPPHDVTWFKDGQQISSDASSGILITKKIETRVLISVLVIKGASMDDSGIYICLSSNRDAGERHVHMLNIPAGNVKRGTVEKITSKNRANSIMRTQYWQTCTALIISLTLFAHIWKHKGV